MYIQSHIAFSIYTPLMMTQELIVSMREVINPASFVKPIPVGKP